MNLRNATLQEFVQFWLVNVKSKSVKAATLNRLYVEAKALASYPISQMQINDITLLDIQTYINQLVDDGYSYTTVVKQRHIVTAPLRYAYRAGLTDRNHCDGVEMPAKESILKPDRAVEALTQQQQIPLLAYIHSNPCMSASLVEFLLETGLRVGEAQALCWNDVDWKKETIQINKTILNSRPNHKSIVQSSPKTPSSLRTIPLSKRAKEILQSLLPMRNGDYVFHHNGRIVGYSGLIKWFKKACIASNIDPCGLHVLRHTFATNCYYKGCNVKILSKLLGHSSTAITYNAYIDLYGDGLEDMRSIVNECKIAQ